MNMRWTKHVHIKVIIKIYPRYAKYCPRCYFSFIFQKKNNKLGGKIVPRRINPYFALFTYFPYKISKAIYKRTHTHTYTLKMANNTINWNCKMFRTWGQSFWSNQSTSFNIHVIVKHLPVISILGAHTSASPSSYLVQWYTNCLPWQCW